VSDAQTSRVQTDAHTTQRSVVKAGGETEYEQAMARIRPVYCGNFEYDARQSEIERMFTSYGKVERVDMKTGMCFLSSLSLFLSISLSAPLFFFGAWSCACCGWSSTLFVTSLACLFALFCALWRAVVLFCEGQMGAVFVCACVCAPVLTISAGCFLVRINSFKRFCKPFALFCMDLLGSESSLFPPCVDASGIWGSCL